MGGKLIAEYRPQESSYFYYATDQIGSTRIVTDDTGAVVYAAAHDSWGGIQQTWTSAYDPALKFSGKERDTESGLDYFGARYYDHHLYRFLSVDPVIPGRAALSNPQRWNLYQYCRNNPICFVDQFGGSDNYFGVYYELYYMGYWGGFVIKDSYALDYWVNIERDDGKRLFGKAGSFGIVNIDIVVWDSFIWISIDFNIGILKDSHLWDQPNIGGYSEENAMRHEMRHLGEYLWVFNYHFSRIARDWKDGIIKSKEDLDARITMAHQRARRYTESRWDYWWQTGYWLDIAQNWIPFLQDPFWEWLLCR